MFWTRTRSLLPRATFGDHFDLFSRFIGNGDEVSTSFPAFNVWSNEEGAILTSELPGIKMEDLDITVTGKEVTIKGARKEGDGYDARYLRRERPAGEFTRSFEVPYQIDAARVEAKLSNGILRIELPRAENDKPRKIAVSAG